MIMHVENDQEVTFFSSPWLTTPTKVWTPFSMKVRGPPLSPYERLIKGLNDVSVDYFWQKDVKNLRYDPPDWGLCRFLPHTTLSFELSRVLEVPFHSRCCSGYWPKFKLRQFFIPLLFDNITSCIRDTHGCLVLMLSSSFFLSFSTQ